jgi:cyclopropane-fatty-acyl-phospholipid synthase
MPSDAPPLETVKARSTDGLARKFLLGILGKLKRGKITIIEGPNRYVFGETSSLYPLEAVINVYHPRFYRKAVLGGSIGSAEAYMNGLWSADDLTTALRIMALNRDSFERLDKGWSKVSAPLNRAWHFLRKNTRSGSRKNIVAHYDLGNDFYRLFLDDTLTYSEDSTMRDASIAKYNRICQKLELSPDDKVIEIGSGWGGFAIYAAQNFGCRVTTTTISDQQFKLAKERIADSGVADRIDLVMKDYRDLKGKYDRLVSIEMIEAVGHHYLDDFFRSCSQLLKPDGVMLLQAITITDQIFERHKRSVDFIKRYIFPGSCIPSITAMTKSIATSTDLRLFHLEDITPHYSLCSDTGLLAVTIFQEYRCSQSAGIFRVLYSHVGVLFQLL